MSDIKKSFSEGLDTIKTLTGVSQADFDTLKSAEPEASLWVEEIAQIFYDTLFAHARTANVFHNEEHPACKEALKSWYRALFTTANDDDAYWNEQGKIAFAHIRHHVNNEFMIGIAAKLSEVFLIKAVAAYSLERGLAISNAFNRILQTVVGLTAEGYDVISEIAFSEATGANPQLIDRLIQDQVDEIQAKLSE